MKIYKSEIYYEDEFDGGNDPIHYHFNCPVCLKGHEPTNVYGMYLDEYLKAFESTIECEDCQSPFYVIYDDGCDMLICSKKELEKSGYVLEIVEEY